MDRFIETSRADEIWAWSCLKSNMDRFIGYSLSLLVSSFLGLKSNMDRFIVKASSSSSKRLYLFKIQYG